MGTIKEKIERLKKELDEASNDEKFRNLAFVAGGDMTKSAVEPISAGKPKKYAVYRMNTICMSASNELSTVKSLHSTTSTNADWKSRNATRNTNNRSMPVPESCLPQKQSANLSETDFI